MNVLMIQCRRESSRTAMMMNVREFFCGYNVPLFHEVIQWSKQLMTRKMSISRKCIIQMNDVLNNVLTELSQNSLFFQTCSSSENNL